jgi:hypothetical protein
MNYLNSTHPRWISSKQIPDEYLLPITELEDNEYYDFSNETDFQRGTNKSKVWFNQFLNIIVYFN